MASKRIREMTGERLRGSVRKAMPVMSSVGSKMFLRPGDQRAAEVCVEIEILRNLPARPLPWFRRAIAGRTDGLGVPGSCPVELIPVAAFGSAGLCAVGRI